MIKIISAAVVALLLSLASLTGAQAQSACSIFTQNNVPTPGQWNQCLQQKQDALGYTAVNRAGDAMTGRLSTIASSTFRSGFAILPGVAPSSPVDGDIWTTTGGIFVRINGATIGPLTATGSTIPAVVQGDILYGTAPVTLAALAKNTTATRALCNTGTNNNPAWCQINLANGVTGNLPLANLVTGTQDTALGYFGSTTASAATLPNCGGALTYNTSTHVFGCNSGGSVIASGTPTANQIAQWINATTIQGANLVSLLATGNGISLSGTTTVTIARAYNEAALPTATPGNPASTGSTTGVMMGLGSTCTITPSKSGRVLFQITSNLSNNAPNNVNANLRFGTGAAPANGVAPAGTQVGSTFIIAIVSSNFRYMAPLSGIVSGLSLGVAVWFDADVFGSANTTTMENVQCQAIEL